MGKTGVDWIDLLSNSDFSDFEWDVELVDVLLSLPSDRHPNRRQGGRFAISSTEVPDILSKVPSAPDWRLDYNLRLPNLERLVTATQALLADQPVGDDLDLAEYAHYWRSRERLQVVARTCFPAFGQGERRVFQWNVAVAATNRREGRVVYSLHGTDGRDGNAVSRALDPKVIDSIETAVSAVRTSLGVTDGLDDLVIGVSAVPASHQPTAYRDFGGRSGTLALAVALAAAWSGDKPGMLLRNCLFTGDLDDQGNIIQVEGGEDLDKARAADDYGFRVFYDNSNRVYESTSFDAVRSQGLRDVSIHLTNYRRELLEWVRSKIDELDRLVEPLGGPDLASAYEAVPCRVLKREVTLEPLSTNSDASDEEAQVHPAEPTSLEEQIAGGSAFREQSVAQEFRGTSAVLSEWNDLADVPLVIVGDPGTGKTFLTRSIARQQLRNWMESLDRGDRNSRFVLWIQLERLKGLADDLESLPKPSDDDTATVAIDFLIKVLAPANENLRIQLSKALLEEPLDLVFDGFDQATFLHGVEPESRSQSWGVSSDRALPHRRILGRLVDRMRSECRDHDVRVMAVTRPIARDALLKEFPPPDELFPTYEVAGFDVASLKAFVGVRLRESASQEVVLEQFQRAIVAREIFLVPYLLGLVCRLAEVGRLKQTDQLNRFELFERVVKLQITEAVGSDAEVKVAAPLRVLSHMSATLWDSHAGRCLFTLREWQDALVDSADRVAQGADPAYIEQVLRKARLFDLGVEDSDAWSSPAHRMILEFLRGYLMKRQLDLKGWEASDTTFPHSVEQMCVFKGWDPQWREVFLFLAAHLAERKVDGVMGGWMARFLRLMDGSDEEAWTRAGWQSESAERFGERLPTDDLLSNRLDLSVRCLRQCWRLYGADCVTEVPADVLVWSEDACRRYKSLPHATLLPAMPALFHYRSGRYAGPCDIDFSATGFDLAFGSTLHVRTLLDPLAFERSIPYHVDVSDSGVKRFWDFRKDAKWSESEADLRRNATDKAGEWSVWGDRELLLRILDRMEHDDDSHVRRAAAEGAGLWSVWGDRELLLRILDRMEHDDDSHVRRAAAEAAGLWSVWGDRGLLLRILDRMEYGDDSHDRRAAAKAAGLWSVWSDQSLINHHIHLIENHEDHDLRLFATELVGSWSPGDRTLLERFVDYVERDESPLVRRASAGVVASWSKWGDKKLLSRILNTVEDAAIEADTRIAATYTLRLWSRVGDRHFLDRLLERIENDINENVCIVAAEVVGAWSVWGDRQMLERLLNVMERHESSFVREATAVALGFWSQWANRKLLERVLHCMETDQYARLRVAAAKLVSSWRTVADEQCLVRSLTRLPLEAEPECRAALAESAGSLSSLGNRSMLEQLFQMFKNDQYPFARRSAAKALGSWSYWADIDLLKCLIDHPEEDHLGRYSGYNSRGAVGRAAIEAALAWQSGPRGSRRFFNEGMFLVADLSRLPD